MNITDTPRVEEKRGVPSSFSGDGRAGRAVKAAPGNRCDLWTESAWTATCRVRSSQLPPGRGATVVKKGNRKCQYNAWVGHSILKYLRIVYLLSWQFQKSQPGCGPQTAESCCTTAVLDSCPWLVGRRNRLLRRLLHQPECPDGWKKNIVRVWEGNLNSRRSRVLRSHIYLHLGL